MTVVVVLFGLCGVAAAQQPDAAPPASRPAPDAAPEAAVPATKVPAPAVETPSVGAPSVPSPQAPPPPAESPPPRVESSTSPAAPSPPAKTAPAESGRTHAPERSAGTERRRHAAVDERPTIASPPVFPQRVVAIDNGPPLSIEARLAALALLMAAAGSLGLVRHLRRWTVQ